MEAITVVPRESLTKYIIYVAIIHILVSGLLYIFGDIKIIDLNLDKINKTKVIRSSVKVDVVAMPKFTVKELKQMNDTTDGAAAVRAEKKELNLSSGKGFLSKLKNFSKKKVKKIVKQKVKRKNTKSVIDRKKLKNLIHAGNQLSKGKSLTGDLTDKNLTEFEKYAGGLPDTVRPSWTIPSYLKDQDLRCRIRIFLSRTGELVKSEIFESSGDDEFDRLAMRAVRNTNYPKPSKDIVSYLIRGEIILGFPL